MSTLYEYKPLGCLTGRYQSKIRLSLGSIPLNNKPWFIKIQVLVFLLNIDLDDQFLTNPSFGPGDPMCEIART